MIAVLDTNAYSDWRRFGHWNSLIARAEKIIVPAIVLGELRSGFLRSARARENERKLVRFLGEKLVVIGMVGDETSHHYAILKNHLRTHGKPIPEADVWIAAITVEHAALLLTRDRHFENLPQVRLADIEEA